MNLAKLLIINAVATAAAGIVLFLRPDLIAGVVGIYLDPGDYFLYYLLGSSELAFAVLCYSSRNLQNAEALRIVTLTCIVFHAASGVAGIYASIQGLSLVVWGNVALRVLMVTLFIYYGIYRPSLKAEGR